jgi:hypothetical protein
MSHGIAAGEKERENMFCLPLFHHVSDILFVQFFHPCGDEKNIGNGVQE